MLRLSTAFALPHLHEHAARWLATNLTTANVVARMVTCEEFGLGRLRERMMDQLTTNPAQLAAVSTSPEIMQHPRILQDLLVHVASLSRPGKRQEEEEEQPASPPPRVEKPAPAPAPAAEKRPAQVAERPAGKRGRKAAAA